LSATDAAGKKLSAWLEVQGEHLLLRVSDTGTRYPVVIDPWVQRAELTASDGTSGDTFGSSVSISGNTVVVGSPNSNNRRGAAYVFVRPASGWANLTQTAKFTASNASSTRNFGFSVSVSGNTVVVGNPDEAVGGIQNQGAAYVFVRPASGWRDMTQTAELTVPYGKADVSLIRSIRRSGKPTADNVGWSVFISGHSVVAGAPGHNYGTGAAYVFLKPAGGWRPTSKFDASFTAKGGKRGDAFGQSVSTTGNTVLVGAYLAAIGRNSRQGAAHVFRPSGGR
jgi:uncharacterized protein (DUF2345 family)